MTLVDDVARWLAAFGIRATSVAEVIRAGNEIHVRLHNGVRLSGSAPVIRHGSEA